MVHLQMLEKQFTMASGRLTGEVRNIMHALSSRNIECLVSAFKCHVHRLKCSSHSAKQTTHQMLVVATTAPTSPKKTGAITPKTEIAHIFSRCLIDIGTGTKKASRLGSPPWVNLPNPKRVMYHRRFIFASPLLLNEAFATSWDGKGLTKVPSGEL